MNKSTLIQTILDYDNGTITKEILVAVAKRALEGEAERKPREKKEPAPAPVWIIAGLDGKLVNFVDFKEEAIKWIEEQVGEKVHRCKRRVGIYRPIAWGGKADTKAGEKDGAAFDFQFTKWEGSKREGLTVGEQVLEPLKDDWRKVKNPTPTPYADNYEEKVSKVEAKGISRSDAQAIIDAEELPKGFVEVKDEVNEAIKEALTNPKIVPLKNGWPVSRALPSEKKAASKKSAAPKATKAAPKTTAKAKTTRKPKAPATA